MKASDSLSARLMRKVSGLGLRFFRFFNRDIVQEPPPAQGPIQLSFASELQLLDLCGREGLDLRSAAVSAAFERGDLCVVAYEGTRLAGYCWLAFAPLPQLDGVWVRFAPDVVWTYKSLVLPEYRGRGIAPLLYRFADQRCLERRRTCSVLCIETHNGSSIRAALNAAYTDGGSAGYVRRSGLFFDWYSPAEQRERVSFFVPK